MHSTFKFTFGLLGGVRYTGAVFHVFYCNFGRAEEDRSLYRGAFVVV